MCRVLPAVGAMLAGLVPCAQGLAQPCVPHWSDEFSLGPNNAVKAIHVRGSGATEEVFIGGHFTQVGAMPAVYVARRFAGTWTTLSGLAQGCACFGAPGVYALADFDAGSGMELYAGGQLYVTGAPSEGLARWDGGAWHIVGGGVALTCIDCPAAVLALKAHDDGRGPSLFVAGAFNRVEWPPSLPCCGVVRWDGSAWDTLNGGFGPFSCTVDALAVYNDGETEQLYASTWTGPFAGIARWDGTQWWHVPGSHTSSSLALTAFDDGAGNALYAAEVMGDSGRVRRWRRSWLTLGTIFNNSVLALSGFDDGSGAALYAGGKFNAPGGGKGLVRWNGTAWTVVGGGPSGFVAALAPSLGEIGPSLLVGGGFATVGAGVPSQNIARWVGCEAGCYPDCDGGGALTIADFACFQTRFVAADPYADCTQSGGLSIADFACFQSKFVAGCP